MSNAPIKPEVVSVFSETTKKCVAEKKVVFDLLKNSFTPTQLNKMTNEDFLNNFRQVNTFLNDMLKLSKLAKKLGTEPQLADSDKKSFEETKHKLNSNNIFYGDTTDHTITIKDIIEVQSEWASVASELEREDKNVSNKLKAVEKITDKLAGMLQNPNYHANEIRLHNAKSILNQAENYLNIKIEKTKSDMKDLLPLLNKKLHLDECENQKTADKASIQDLKSKVDPKTVNFKASKESLAMEAEPTH